ncbi:hypothetical protein ABR759_00690 [Escherichia coli]
MKRVVMPVRWQCAKMPMLVLWKPALPPVLATLPLIFLLTPSGQPADYRPFLTDSSFHSY